jgi:hypothetical protein
MHIAAKPDCFSHLPLAPRVIYDLSTRHVHDELGELVCELGADIFPATGNRSITELEAPRFSTHGKR